MRLLLDTHVLIWWIGTPLKLPQGVRDHLSEQSNEVLVSSITPWEIAIKVGQGKLTFDPTFLSDFDAALRRLAFEPLPILAAHAMAGANLQGRHKDPFDRMLAGQAQVEGLTIVTADPQIASFGVPVLW